jgi:hypothetical protein
LGGTAVATASGAAASVAAGAADSVGVALGAQPATTAAAVPIAPSFRKSRRDSFFSITSYLHWYSALTGCKPVVKRQILAFGMVLSVI